MSDEAARSPEACPASRDDAIGQHLSPAASSASASPRAWLSSVRRPRTSPGPRASALKRTLLTEDDARRDSALASSNSTASTDLATHNTPSTPTSLRRTPSLPAIVVHDDQAAQPSHTSPPAQAGDLPHADSGDTFQINTIIPTGGLDDLTSPTQVSFSKRGSMLLGGKRANKMNKHLGLVGQTAPASQASPRLQEQEEPQDQKKELSAPAKPTPRLCTRTPSRLSARGRAASSRVLSADEMMLSRKVRSMYQHGNESAAGWDDVEEESESIQTSFADSSLLTGTPANGSSLTVDRSRGDASSIVSSRQGNSFVIPKEAGEVAGGIEDWTELEGEVDRYGFIIPKKTGSRGSSPGEGADGPQEPRLQRVSTALKLVSEEPRRRGIGRSVSRARSSRTAKTKSGSPSRRRSQASTKPPPSLFSNRTARSTPQKSLRQATNRLPHNRGRRLLDEASDMLKLPPGLADVAEQQEGGKAAQAMKAKEIEREEKWRKMAKVVQSGAKSGGMMFEFDVKDPKVISRTWKGIPDRWRATAWYAFLAASAKAHDDSPSDEELVASFYELQEESSADDMQIDVDVPRTINRHIMFRRRYRGG